MDRFLRKIASLVGPFCCILCGKVEENLDYLLLASLRSLILLACQRDVWLMIEDKILKPSSRNETSVGISE